MIRFDARELTSLAADFGDIERESLPAMRSVIQEASSDLKEAWRASARETAGAHGRHYPNSITYETRLLASAVEGEIGPDPSRPQGGMSFEYGSVNQPPHLNGNRAADELVPLIERRVSASLAFLGL